MRHLVIATVASVAALAAADVPPFRHVTIDPPGREDLRCRHGVRCQQRKAQHCRLWPRHS